MQDKFSVNGVTIRSPVIGLHRRMPQYKELLIAVERRATGTHGIITRDEAKESGISDHVIDDCLRCGRWVRVHSGVFRIATFPQTFEGRALAALKWAGEDDAFLSHGSVLALEGLDGFPKREIHITAPTGSSIDGVIVHRLRRPARTRIRRGIRTCRIERALLDACAHSTPLRCGNAMDDALRKQLTTLDRLWSELGLSGRGLRGAAIFRTLLKGRDWRDGKLQSKLEAKLLAILRRIKEYDFDTQAPITARGKRYRLDFVHWPCRLGVESHGVRWHLGNEWITRDWDRHNNLVLAGFTMLYYTWDDVHFRPDEVEAEIREMLRSLPAIPQTLI